MAVHVLIWRTLQIRRQSAWLVSIFLGAPSLVFVGYLLFGAFREGPLEDPEWLMWFLAYLLHVSLSGAYLFLYTGVAGFSPTIAILENVARNTPSGLTQEHLAPSWFNDDTLSGSRHQNLLSGGLISESTGRIYLSPRGRMIATAFLIFRRFLGLSDVARG